VYTGDSVHAPTTSSATVQVSRLPTVLSIVASGRVFAYGALGTITVHLGPTYATRLVRIYDYVYQVSYPRWTLIYSADVNSAGNIVLPVRMYRHVSFMVTYTGDAIYTRATASVGVSALAAMNQSVLGSYGASGSYRLVHQSVNPGLIVLFLPNRRYYGCVRFTAEAYSSGRWKLVATSVCIQPNATSHATAYLTGSRNLGVPYRLQAALAGDNQSAPTTGQYAYLEFTT
jgi:hypothetical protein